MSQCLITIFLLLEFSEGSIIASINVSFLAIDALQLISLQEELAGGTLGTTPAELLNLSSSYGKDSASITELQSSFNLVLIIVPYKANLTVGRTLKE